MRVCEICEVNEPKANAATTCEPCDTAEAEFQAMERMKDLAWGGKHACRGCNQKLARGFYFHCAACARVLEYGVQEDEDRAEDLGARESVRGRGNSIGLEVARQKDAHPDAPKEKACITCEVVKLKTEFNLNSAKKFGRLNVCRTCASEATAERRRRKAA